MYIYVKGTSGNYEVGDVIYNPVNVYGLKDRNGFQNLYNDIRPLYGDPITPGGTINPESINPELRKEEGFWSAVDVYINVAGDYKILAGGQPVYTFDDSIEGDVILTVTRTWNYIWDDLANIKADLVLRINAERDIRVNAGYTYKGTFFDTTISGRQMLNSYYALTLSGVTSVSIYMTPTDENPTGMVTLTAAEMQELFQAVMNQTNGYYSSSSTQRTNVNAATSPEDAMAAATWIYPAA